MKYISGIHALNINCRLETCGDWHASAINWHKIKLLDSDNTIFGDYGIEINKSIPIDNNKYNIANHIRAVLDLLYEGNFALAQGMNKDFICNNKYNDEIFDKVMLMKHLPHFNMIDNFMGKEYLTKWLDYKKKRGYS